MLPSVMAPLRSRTREKEHKQQHVRGQALSTHKQHGGEKQMQERYAAMSATTDMSCAEANKGARRISQVSNLARSVTAVCVAVEAIQFERA